MKASCRSRAKCMYVHIYRCMWTYMCQGLVLYVSGPRPVCVRASSCMCQGLVLYIHMDGRICVRVSSSLRVCERVFASSFARVCMFLLVTDCACFYVHIWMDARCERALHECERALHECERVYGWMRVMRESFSSSFARKVASSAII